MPRHTGATARLNAIGYDLWLEGRIDREIAARCGCAKSMVCMWRKRHGLASNAPPGSEDWVCSLPRTAKGQQALALMHLGDVQAAKLCGITVAAFRKRRWRMGIKPGEIVK